MDGFSDQPLSEDYWSPPPARVRVLVKDVEIMPDHIAEAREELVRELSIPEQIEIMRRIAKRRANILSALAKS